MRLPILSLIAVAVVLGGSVGFALRNTLNRDAAPIAAVITNDSTSVDLDAFGGANEGGGGGTSPSIFGDEPGGGSGSSESGNTASESGPSSTSSVIQEVTVVYASSASGGAVSEAGVQESASGILSALIGGQGVSLSASGSSASSDPSAPANASGAAGSSSEGGGLNVRVRGDEVRKALFARGIDTFSIPGYFSSDGNLIGRLRSPEDVALAVASYVSKNRNFDEVLFSLGQVSITYRARGRLFAVIPLGYQVRILVDPNSAPDGRIAVKFPWYKFFLQTFVSKQTLERELGRAITDVLAEPRVTADTEARLFSAVSLALSERFDTIEGSVR